MTAALTFARFRPTDRQTDGHSVLAAAEATRAGRGGGGGGAYVLQCSVARTGGNRLDVELSTRCSWTLSYGRVDPAEHRTSPVWMTFSLRGTLPHRRTHDFTTERFLLSIFLN